MGACPVLGGAQEVPSSGAACISGLAGIQLGSRSLCWSLGSSSRGAGGCVGNQGRSAAVLLYWECNQTVLENGAFLILSGVTITLHASFLVRGTGALTLGSSVGSLVHGETRHLMYASLWQITALLLLWWCQIEGPRLGVQQ